MFIKSNNLVIGFILLIWLANFNVLKSNEDVYGTLIISSINLKEKIYAKNSLYNELKYGLYLHPISTDLKSEFSNIIIASHSGNADISYFKNLDKLKINDEIKIISKKKTFLFRIINIYEDKKDGNVKINRYNTKTLSLVTCKKNTTDLHLIISAVYQGKLEKKLN